MSNEFQIPAKPWGEAEVAFLTANVMFLPEDVKAELGLTPVAPINDFRADDVVVPPITEEVVAPTEEVPVVELEPTQVDPEAAGLPTEVDGAVDNEGGDNA